jgi:signal peptidase I
VRRVIRVVRNLLAVIGFVVVLRHTCFDVSQIVSPSMSPTLVGDAEHDIPGDWVISERVSYWFRAPRRWEIVRFWCNDGFWVVKRVAGLPGETVSLPDNWVSINGVPLRRPAPLSFLVYYPYGKCRNGTSVSCGNGYFLLGDHSKDSQDSRYEGPMSPERISGRAWLRVWPLSRFGWVNP